MLQPNPASVIFILLVALTQATCIQAANSHTGTVVSITDGDTIKILTLAKQQIKVRLADIDTPEKRQPYGKKAKKILSDKIYGKQVEVEKVTTDRYKRLVGRVYFRGRNINSEMVADGAAWVYRKYSKDPELLKLERQAKKKRLGLWALPYDQRVPPWEWRRDTHR